jgi:sugar phosphate isomerase/epimerase
MFSVPVTFMANFRGKTSEERCKIMEEYAAAGVEHLVLTNSIIAMMLDDAGLVTVLPDEMRKFGLDFVDAHAPFQVMYDPIYPYPERRREMILRHKLHLNLCREVGVNTYTVHVGNDFPYPEVPPETNFKNICDALEQILPEAEDCGVTVCIENIWVRSNVSPVLLAIKKKFPTPFLGLCYDSGHANLMEKGWQYEENDVTPLWRRVGEEPVWQKDVLSEMLPDIVNCHLHDNFGQHDQHLCPGDGNIDWNYVIKMLKSAPRLKCIQCESGKPSIDVLVKKFKELGEI